MQCRPHYEHRAVFASKWTSVKLVCIRQHASDPCHRYAPLQERALWDGLAAMHNEAC
jgi:hypothetical protein